MGVKNSSQGVTNKKVIFQLGFKPKIEKNNKAFDPEFFIFLSGIPNFNLYISTFRSKISEELANYESRIKLNQNEKIDFLNF